VPQKRKRKSAIARAIAKIKHDGIASHLHAASRHHGITALRHLDLGDVRCSHYRALLIALLDHIRSNY